MKRYLFVLVGAALLFGQGKPKPAPAKPPAASASAKPVKSALDKPTLEAYVRHLQLYLPQVSLAVSDPKPSELPGFVEVTVRATLGGASEERLFYVSKDGRKIVQGTVYDVARSPFQPDLDKLKVDGNPSIGTPGAPVVIALFSDFQCSYCKEEAKMLRDNLLKQYPTQVRLYFKDFPLNQIHPWAATAAAAGRCAYKQSNEDFWTYHDWVFENQASLTAENARDKIAEFARTKGWNAEALNACIADPAMTAAVERSLSEGRTLGITSTPTMFINGRKIAHAIKWENLKQIIDFEIGHLQTAGNAGEACCSVQLSSPLTPPARK